MYKSLPALSCFYSFVDFYFKVRKYIFELFQNSGDTFVREWDIFGWSVLYLNFHSPIKPEVNLLQVTEVKVRRN